MWILAAAVTQIWHQLAVNVCLGQWNSITQTIFQKRKSLRKHAVTPYAEMLHLWFGTFLIPNQQRDSLSFPPCLTWSYGQNERHVSECFRNAATSHYQQNRLRTTTSAQQGRNPFYHVHLMLLQSFIRDHHPKSQGQSDIGNFNILPCTSSDYLSRHVLLQFKPLNPLVTVSNTTFVITCVIQFSACSFTEPPRFSKYVCYLKVENWWCLFSSCRCFGRNSKTASKFETYPSRRVIHSSIWYKKYNFLSQVPKNPLFADREIDGLLLQTKKNTYAYIRG